MKYKILLVVGICLGSVTLAACGNQQLEAVTETEIVTTLVEETESEMETETEEPETETEKPEQEPESEAEPEFERYTRFTNTEANIRNLPTADGSEVIKTVPVNTEVTVIGVKGDWSQLESEDGTDQYIKSSLLGERPVEQQASTGTSTGTQQSTSSASSQATAPAQAQPEAASITPAPAPSAPEQFANADVAAACAGFYDDVWVESADVVDFN